MSTVKNKIEFTVEKDGKKIELCVKRPSLKVQNEAQLAYSKAYADLVRGGAVLGQKMASVAKEQGVFNESYAKEIQEIGERMRTLSRKFPDESGKTLDKGVTLSEARKAAIDMHRERTKLQKLVSQQNAVYQNTAEKLAEDTRFNYFVSACTFLADVDKKYFLSLDDYLSRSNDPDAYEAAVNFANLYYDVDANFENTLPENAFLLKYGLVDKDLRLVNREGRFVDEDFNLVNELGQRVDVDGRVLDEQGKVVVEEERFELVDDLSGK